MDIKSRWRRPGGDGLAGGPGAERAPRCFGKQASVEDHQGKIEGTDGNDVIVGDDGDNDIDGLGGIDRDCGNGGDDRIVAFNRGQRPLADGGSDPDTVNGNGRDDKVRGGAGDELVIGNSGGDEVRGGDGNDTLFGIDGIDDLAGGKGSDTCDEDFENVGQPPVACRSPAPHPAAPPIVAAMRHRAGSRRRTDRPGRLS